MSDEILRTSGAAGGNGGSDLLREQMAAYALGALDADACLEVERAIAGSPGLGAELDAWREVGALLAYAAEPRAVPAGLRERVVATADLTLPEHAPLTVSRGARSAPPAATAPGGGSAFVRALPWLLVAASLVGVATTWRGLLNERGARELAEGERRGLQSQVAMLDSLVATLTASDLSTVMLSSTGAPPSARLYWNRERGQVLLAAFRLPPAPAGRTYQLWGIAEGQAPVSLGTFSSAGEGREVVRFPVPAGLQLAIGAVTEEPAGGSPQPTSAPFLAGTLRATE
jgi:anti-sigma-K factor RskA